MGKLVDGLNVIISNPDDLSTLPTLVAMANEMESNDKQDIKWALEAFLDPYLYL